MIVNNFRVMTSIFSCFFDYIRSLPDKVGGIEVSSVDTHMMTRLSSDLAHQITEVAEKNCHFSKVLLFERHNDLIDLNILIENNVCCSHSSENAKAK